MIGDYLNENFLLQCDPKDLRILSLNLNRFLSRFLTNPLTDHEYLTVARRKHSYNWLVTFSDEDELIKLHCLYTCCIILKTTISEVVKLAKRPI